MFQRADEPEGEKLTRAEKILGRLEKEQEEPLPPPKQLERKEQPIRVSKEAAGRLGLEDLKPVTTKYDLALNAVGDKLSQYIPTALANMLPAQLNEISSPAIREMNVHYWENGKYIHEKARAKLTKAVCLRYTGLPHLYEKYL